MMTQLELCNALFNLRVEKLSQEANRLSAEEILSRVDSLAHDALSLIPTCLAHPRIEQLLIECGHREMLSQPLPGVPSQMKRKILHVSTVVYPVGGHTRIIANWMKLDKNSDHAVVLTCQSVPIPEWFVQVTKTNGSELVELDTTKTKLERSKKLRQFAVSRKFTHIVLHHFAYDSIPLLAFASDGGPPVLVYNHADNVFWNGSSLADAVIDYSSMGMEVSRRYRGARTSLYLPFVVGKAPPFVKRVEAKIRLGLSPETVLLVSINRKPKYIPWQNLNFFSTYGKLLDSLPNARLVVIGVGDADRPELGISQKPPNMILAGEVIDPSIYAMAADIYAESFPLGAGLGACDMCRYGAAPLFAYGKGLTIYGTLSRGVFEDGPLPPLMQTEEDQINFAFHLCRDEKKRIALGSAFANYINSRCVGENWLAYLDQVYKATDGLEHRVATDYKIELLSTARCTDFNAYTCKDSDWVFYSLLREMRKTSSLTNLRNFAGRLSKCRCSRQLLRNALELFFFFGRSLVEVAKLPFN